MFTDVLQMKYKAHKSNISRDSKIHQEENLKHGQEQIRIDFKRKINLLADGCATRWKEVTS